MTEKQYKKKLLARILKGDKQAISQLATVQFKPVDLRLLSDEQLEAILFAQMTPEERAAYRPLDTLTDEELDALLAQLNAKP